MVLLPFFFLFFLYPSLIDDFYCPCHTIAQIGPTRAGNLGYKDQSQNGPSFNVRIFEQVNNIQGMWEENAY